jgi:hypothetical protein
MPKDVTEGESLAIISSQMEQQCAGKPITPAHETLAKIRVLDPYSEEYRQRKDEMREEMALDRSYGGKSDNEAAIDRSYMDDKF